MPDFFVTMHAALGIDYTKNLHDGDRPVLVTDLGQQDFPHSESLTMTASPHHGYG